MLDKEYGAEAGTIVETDKKGFIVQCGKGSARVAVLQAKGGKIMPTDAYMRGHQIDTGVVLG